MISYKTWKLLQENLGHTNLGIKPANVIGTVNEAPGLFGMMKKKDKPAVPDMGGDGSTGEEDHEDDDMGGEDHDHEDDDMDGEEGGGDDDMGGDEEDHDHEDGDDMGDEDDMGDDMGGENGPPMKKKKPMPPMGDMGAKAPMMMKKEGKDAVDEKDKKQNSSNKVDMLKYKQKGKSSKCSKCDMMAKEEKEGNEFLSKLRDMTGGTKFAKDDEGFWVPVDEDTLLSPEDTNHKASEPAAGEVGYAPTQKLGMTGSQAGSFTEWATNHVKKTRKK